MNKSTRLNQQTLIIAGALILKAYLDDCKADIITVIYTEDGLIKACDYSKAEAFDKLKNCIVLNDDRIALKSKSKKYDLSKSYTVGTVEDFEAFSLLFPKRNEGYRLEYFYRYTLGGENIAEIRTGCDTIPYYVGADTKSGKQIKSINNGATIAEYRTMLRRAENENLIDVITSVIKIKSDKTKR